MKNRLAKYIEELELTPEDRQEALVIWKMAVELFNDINATVQFFPNNVEFDIAHKIKKSSLLIAENLARGINSRQSMDFHNKLDASKDAICSTLAYLWIASQWSYLRKDQYKAFYETCLLLTSRINNLCLVVYTKG